MKENNLSVNHLLGIKFLNISDIKLIFDTANYFITSTSTSMVIIFIIFMYSIRDQN